MVVQAMNQRTVSWLLPLLDTDDRDQYKLYPKQATSEAGDRHCTYFGLYFFASRLYRCLEVSREILQRSRPPIFDET